MTVTTLLAGVAAAAVLGLAALALPKLFYRLLS